MSSNIVAKRYAKALFDIGEKQGIHILRTYNEELSLVAKTVRENSNLLSLFQNPLFFVEEKKDVLIKIMAKLKVTGIVKNFCELLADKDRLDSILKIADDFERRLLNIQGIVKGRLTTAIALSKEREDAIQTQLEAQLLESASLDLVFDVDKTILGGVVLHMGERVLDASLRAQLDMLKETIKRGN